MLRLNVGGCLYSTTKSTLIGDGSNFFKALLSGDFSVTKDPEGNIFIDRDGKAFEAILTFLRSNRLVDVKGVTRETLEDEASFYQIGSLIALLNEEKEKLKAAPVLAIKSNGYYSFGFNSDGSVDEKKCEILNKATRGSSAPFILKFESDSDKCLMSMGSSARENLKIFQAFPRVPNIWGVQGAASYAKMVTELIVRAKYQMEGNAFKLIVGIQPEKFFFGAVTPTGLILALYKPVTQMLMFPGEEPYFDPGFYEAIFVEDETQGSAGAEAENS